MNLSKERVFSIIESFLFVSPEPRSFSEFENLFKEELSRQQIKSHLEELSESYKKQDRGLVLKKAGKGWQIRTKLENKNYLLRVRPSPVFRLSKPSLETLAILAFEQPCTKIKVDEIRGVDSGHLLRNLLEKKLICWAGQSDLPGKPYLYKTTNLFLETFGLESLKALPSEKELEELFRDSNEKQEPESLKSVVEKLDQKALKNKNSQKELVEDEKESKKIKSLLKSFPSNVDFLKRNKEKEQEEQ